MATRRRRRKRRMSPAAVAASRKNLVKARAARSRAAQGVSVNAPVGTGKGRVTVSSKTFEKVKVVKAPAKAVKTAAANSKAVTGVKKVADSPKALANKVVGGKSANSFDPSKIKDGWYGGSYETHKAKFNTPYMYGTKYFKKSMIDQGRDPVTGSKITKEQAAKLTAAAEKRLRATPSEWVKNNVVKHGGTSAEALRKQIRSQKDLQDPLAGTPAKADSTGLVTLYHRTTKANAASIRAHGFDPSKTSRIAMGDTNSLMYFSTRRNGASKDYGDAVVSVKVRASLTLRDPEGASADRLDRATSGDWYIVRTEDLAGVKVRGGYTRKKTRRRRRTTKRKS